MSCLKIKIKLSPTHAIEAFMTYIRGYHMETPFAHSSGCDAV